MKYTGPIFRPPVEAHTLLLQVTVGCAHNECTFCTMYRSVPFQVEPLEQIERDLIEAKRQYGRLKRIFLVNGDAFVLSAPQLKAIAAKIIQYFPDMETITMYASIRNIMAKTDAELAELRQMRINDLYVGLETGHAEVIRNINKGHELADAYRQLERLNQAGIRHMALLMLGVAGRGRGIENAVETAKLLNAVRPSLVWLGTLGIFDDSPLAGEVAVGTFEAATEGEILEEEKKLIELLDLTGVPLYGVHPTNLTSIVGTLPGDRELMLQTIDDAIRATDPAILGRSLPRHSL